MKLLALWQKSIQKGGSFLKRITILDIANELRYSRNTVAKALNGGAVSFETRMTVVKKAMETAVTFSVPLVVDVAVGKTWAQTK